MVQQSKSRLALTTALSIVFGMSAQAPAQATPNGPGTTPIHELQKDESYYETETKEDGRVILKGEVTYTVPKGTPIKLKIASVPTAGLHLLDRTMEGELYPAQVGELLTAKTTEDINVGGDKVIPEGSTFYGYVSKVHKPKRVGRPGYLEIQFKALKLPDKRVFAFRVVADNQKKSTLKTKARGLGRLAAYAGGGGVVGAVVAYKVVGLHGTISMHGYNVAGGAAAGALMATTYAIFKRGKPAVLEPGEDLNMTIDSDLLMPAAQKRTAKKPLKQLDGLDIKVIKSKKIDDGLDAKVLVTDLMIDNNTGSPISSMDVFLEDTNGTRNPIVALDDESETLWQITPYSQEKVHVGFQMQWPKLKHKIVVLDHDTRIPLHFVKVD